MNTFTLVVTGHRPAGKKLDRVVRMEPNKPVSVTGYDFSTLKILVAIARCHLEFLRPERVIAGGAQGWDTACQIAALQLNIPLTVVLAFPSIAEKWVQDRSYFYWLKTLSLADEIVLLHRDLPESKEQAALWLQERNEAMVDRAQKVLALWNGLRGGGTDNCLKYAAKMGRSMRNAWPDWLKATSGNNSNNVL